MRRLLPHEGLKKQVQESIVRSNGVPVTVLLDTVLRVLFEADPFGP